MAGNPADSRFRVAFGTLAGGPTSAFTGLRLRSETLGFEAATIEDDSIRGSSGPPEPLESKLDVGGSTPINWSAEEHLRLWANLHGAANAAVESPTGVFTQRFGRSQSGVTFPTPLLIDAYRDDGRPERYSNIQVQSYSFTNSPRAIENGEVALLGSRFDIFDDAEEVAVTATPSAPVLRGIPKFSHLGSADGNVFFKVTTGPSGGAVGISLKVGAAASYSFEITGVTAAAWFDALDESGAHIGDEGLPVQFYLPDVTLTLNDEWRFDRERAAWSQVLPAAAVFNEIATAVFMDGASFRINEYSVTVAKPWTIDEVIGGRFMDDLLLRGDWPTVEGTINRNNLGTRDLRDRLLRAEPFALIIDRYSSTIESTTSRRRWRSIMPRCIPGGRSASIPDRLTFPEALNFTAHASADVTYPDPITEELTTSTEDITAPAVVAT
jgi:hypothetical protein